MKSFPLFAPDLFTRLASSSTSLPLQPSRALDFDFFLSFVFCYSCIFSSPKKNLKSDVNYRLSRFPEPFVHFWCGPRTSSFSAFWCFTFDNVYKVIILHQVVLYARRKDLKLSCSMPLDAGPAKRSIVPMAKRLVMLINRNITTLAINYSTAFNHTHSSRTTLQACWLSLRRLIFGETWAPSWCSNFLMEESR